MRQCVQGSIVVVSALVAIVCLTLTHAAQRQDTSRKAPVTPDPEYDDYVMPPRAAADSLPGDFLWLLKAEEDIHNSSKDMLREALRRSKVPTAKAAVRTANFAAGSKPPLDGLYGGPSARVVELVRLGVGIIGFAGANDFVWVVRFYVNECVYQEAWVSSTTAEVIWVFPPEPLELRERKTRAPRSIASRFSCHFGEQVQDPPVFEWEVAPGIPKDVFQGTLGVTWGRSVSSQ